MHSEFPPGTWRVSGCVGQSLVNVGWRLESGIALNVLGLHSGGLSLSSQRFLEDALCNSKERCRWVEEGLWLGCWLLIKPFSFPSTGFGLVMLELSPPHHSACFSLSGAVHHPSGWGRQMTAVT